MTPQEKAIEIFNSMKGFRVKHSHAKKCAINAVDLVLKSLSYSPHPYWLNVKEELKKIKTP
jgi:hypothetical protein